MRQALSIRNEYDKLKQSTIQPSRRDPFPIQKGVQPVFSEPSRFEDLSTHRYGPGFSSTIALVTPDFWLVTRPPALLDHKNLLNNRIPEQTSTLKSARLFWG